jgi:hypothetical protein
MRVGGDGPQPELLAIANEFPVFVMEVDCTVVLGEAVPLSDGFLVALFGDAVVAFLSCSFEVDFGDDTFVARVTGAVIFF